MESLNDIVEFYLNCPIINSEINVKKDFDLNLPKKYDEERINILGALGQLDIEFNHAKASNVLFQTKLKRDLQILDIYHDGNRIPEESLAWLNKWLSWLAKDRVDWTQSRHGNLIAAQMLKSLDGRIYLENLVGEDYNVKTTVEIPL